MPQTGGVTVWLALWKVARDVERVADADIAALGLCRTDFAVLELLFNRGPARVNVIAESVMVTSGSMTSAIDRLEERGLVRRAADARDGRARVVELTAAGRELIGPAYADHSAAMERAFVALDEAERETLLRLLLKLRRGLREVAP